MHGRLARENTRRDPQKAGGTPAPLHFPNAFQEFEPAQIRFSVMWSRPRSSQRVKQPIDLPEPLACGERTTLCESSTREIPCEYSRSRNSTPRLQLHFKMQSKRRSPAPSGRLKLTFPAPCLWTVVDSEPWWPCGSWSAGGRAHFVCSILRRRSSRCLS